MNIQQNLNALLTMGAVAARTSNLYQQKDPKEKTKKAKKLSDKADEIIEAAAEKGDQSYVEGAQIDIVAKDEKVKQLEILAKSNPKKYADEYQKALKEQKEAQEFGQYTKEVAAEEDEDAELQQNLRDLKAGKYRAYTPADKQEEVNQAVLKGQTDFIENTRSQRQNSTPEARLAQKLQEEYGFEIPGGKING